MGSSGLPYGRESAPAPSDVRRRTGDRSAAAGNASHFEDQFVQLFDAHFQRLVRFMDRLSGEPELAADLAQESFIRLYRRGSLPDQPEAWLVTVALNLFRNARSSRRRRRQLLTPGRVEATHSDVAPTPADVAEGRAARRRVRDALAQLTERERRLLLLHAEGFRYRDIARIAGLNEASIGTLLARARSAFRKAYEGESDAR